MRDRLLMALGVDHYDHRVKPQKQCGRVEASAEPEATEMLALTPASSCLVKETTSPPPGGFASLPIFVSPHILQLSGVCQTLQGRTIQTHQGEQGRAECRSKGLWWQEQPLTSGL